MGTLRNGWICFLAIVLVGLLPAALAQPIIGLQVRRGDVVTVGSGEVIDGDLLVLARSATVDGTVNGDLILVALTDARVNGTVNGRLVWLGRALTVSGRASNVVYGVGVQLTLGPQARVGRDLAMLGGSLQAQAGSRVEGGVAMGGNQAVLSGTVMRTLRFTGRALTVNGTVRGVTTAWTPRSGPLRPTVGAPAAGAADEAASGGIIGEGVASDQGQDTTGERVLDWFLVFLRALVTLLAVGALALWLVPRAFIAAVEEAQATPLAAAGWGALVWLGGWVVAALAAVVILAAWLILLAVTLESLAWWVLALFGAALALAFSFFLLLVALVSKVVAAYLVGRLILDRLAGRARERRAWSLLLGVVIYLLLRAIPFFGWVVGVVATLIGLGGIWLAFYRRPRRRTRLIPGAGVA